ncbi:phosphotransferase [Paenibacillus cymbidii]|uniref:phosphotransferase n=1 Tax=Paenibacillus cymbidii TaxID=1639034 RepID=UPI0010806BD2|nr:phosphotransferase [Paenibacillus cymbidii]
MPHSAMLPDGTLDDAKITGRDHLYTRRNGRSIERFYMNKDGHTVSYILKPLADESHLGKEAWVQQHVLSLLPTGHARIVANADHDDPGRYWTIFEDMGALSHDYDEPLVLDMAAVIPNWHQLPAALVPYRFRTDADKPSLASKLADIHAGWPQLRATIAELGLAEPLLGRLELLVQRAGDDSEQVVTHGDLHRGNYFARDGAIVVMDWEHLHIGSVYWDLYCLLDMTHPYYPKPSNPQLRSEALSVYMEHRRRLGWLCDRERFIAGYFAHAAICTAWLMLVIEGDLAAGAWDRQQLLDQRQATFAALNGLLQQPIG